MRDPTTVVLTVHIVPIVIGPSPVRCARYAPRCPRRNAETKRRQVKWRVGTNHSRPFVGIGGLTSLERGRYGEKSIELRRSRPPLIDLRSVPLALDRTLISEWTPSSGEIQALGV